MLSKLRSNKGFTLIELMIVVAILGILAAVAVPAFLQYLKRAKTSEMPIMLKRITEGESKYYQAERVDNTGTIARPVFITAGPTPLSPAKGGDKVNPGTSFTTDASWQAIDFAITDPIIASYKIVSPTNVSSDFVAYGHADVNNDGVYSSWKKGGTGTPATKTVTLWEGVQSVNDLE